VLVGCRDRWAPAVGLSEDDFDPRRGGRSRLDELMEAFLGHSEDAHVVERASLGDVGDLHLLFADGCLFETFSDIGLVEPVGDEAPDECWRLFEPAKETPHLVVEPGGVLYLSGEG